MTVTAPSGIQWRVRWWMIWLLIAVPVQAEDRNSYLLATGSTAGSYHRAGVALSTLIKLHVLPEKGIDLNPVNTSGPSANVRALYTDDAQFALVEGLVGYFARRGTGAFAEDGRQHRLRAVAALWPRVEHFVIPTQSIVTRTIDDFLDLGGRKISLGRHDTATIASNWVLMANLGIDIEKHYDLRFLGHRASSQALVRGDLSGMSIPGRLPWGPVEEALVELNGQARILEFTDEQARRADSGFGVWRRFAIPAEIYFGQEDVIWTIAQSNFLAVRDDVPEDVVYRITKAIFDNLHTLRSIDATMQTMAPEQALDGLPVPLHPGAQRYFQEVGRLPASKAISSKEEALLRRAPL